MAEVKTKKEEAKQVRDERASERASERGWMKGCDGERGCIEKRAAAVLLRRHLFARGSGGRRRAFVAGGGPSWPARPARAAGARKYSDGFTWELGAHRYIAG